jgi:hypothetical protein
MIYIKKSQKSVYYFEVSRGIFDLVFPYLRYATIRRWPAARNQPAQGFDQNSSDGLTRLRGVDYYAVVKDGDKEIL